MYDIIIMFVNNFFFKQKDKINMFCTKFLMVLLYLIYASSLYEGRACWQGQLQNQFINATEMVSE